ncbi:MAG: hypothetical protein LW817_05145 [Candidatus Caenarcaniphilales bacterium]|jgi:hypothetical protein|nr:hypothetical protein [Candidatus Caenarcaniphilales bacterium]
MKESIKSNFQLMVIFAVALMTPLSSWLLELSLQRVILNFMTIFWLLIDIVLFKAGFQLIQEAYTAIIVEENKNDF